MQSAKFVLSGFAKPAFSNWDNLTIQLGRVALGDRLHLVKASRHRFRNFVEMLQRCDSVIEQGLSRRVALRGCAVSVPEIRLASLVIATSACMRPVSSRKIDECRVPGVALHRMVIAGSVFAR